MPTVASSERCNMAAEAANNLANIAISTIANAFLLELICVSYGKVFVIIYLHLRCCQRREGNNIALLVLACECGAAITFTLPPVTSCMKATTKPLPLCPSLFCCSLAIFVLVA